MNVEEQLISTECNLRNRQARLGENLIWGTCIFCIGIVVFLVLESVAMSNEHPIRTIAQIFISDKFIHLIVALSIPFVIGLTAGIILIKSSVKSLVKSYLDAFETESSEIDE